MNSSLIRIALPFGENTNWICIWVNVSGFTLLVFGSNYEAHTGKDITRPEFHIRNGVAGFVNANIQNKVFGNHVEIRRAGSNIPEPFYGSAEQENEITDTGRVLATSSEVNTVPRERTVGNL